MRSGSKLPKDDAIKEFKKTTPTGILKSFKDDDDIWDYINRRGEWKDDPNQRRKSNISLDDKMKAAEDLVKFINQAHDHQ